MLRTQEPLTPAATAILRICLEVSDDQVRDFGENYWVTAFPRSARAFTRPQAGELFTTLLDALAAPELYQPTDYHWMLIYEAMHGEVDVLNDLQIPSVNAELARLWRTQDRHYLAVRRGRGKQRPRVRIDFDAFLHVYFWDLDFLMAPDALDGLTPDQKRGLDPNPELFGLLHGLTPAPEELRLTVVPSDATEETDT
jgi:hypothetical protein